MKSVLVNFDVYENSWMWFLDNIYDRKLKIDSNHQFAEWLTRDYKMVDIILDYDMVKFMYQEDVEMMLFIMRFS